MARESPFVTGSEGFKKEFRSIPPKEYVNAPERELKKLRKLRDKLVYNKKFRDKTKSVVVLNNYSIDSIAHELGHSEGRLSLLNKENSKRSKIFENSVDKVHGVFGKSSAPDKKISFKDALKDHFEMKRRLKNTYKEEKEATRGGLRMLKKHGATKKKS